MTSTTCYNVDMKTKLPRPKPGHQEMLRKQRNIRSGHPLGAMNNSQNTITTLCVSDFEYLFNEFDCLEDLGTLRNSTNQNMFLLFLIVFLLRLFLVARASCNVCNMYIVFYMSVM